MNRFPTDPDVILEADDIKEGLNCVICNAELFFDDIEIYFDGEIEYYVVKLKDTCCGKDYEISFAMEDILKNAVNILHKINDKTKYDREFL